MSDGFDVVPERLVELASKVFQMSLAASEAGTRAGGAALSTNAFGAAAAGPEAVQASERAVQAAERAIERLASTLEDDVDGLQHNAANYVRLDRGAQNRLNDAGAGMDTGGGPGSAPPPTPDGPR